MRKAMKAYFEYARTQNVSFSMGWMGACIAWMISSALEPSGIGLLWFFLLLIAIFVSGDWFSSTIYRRQMKIEHIKGNLEGRDAAINFMFESLDEQIAKKGKRP